MDAPLRFDVSQALAGEFFERRQLVFSRGDVRHVGVDPFAGHAFGDQVVGEPPGVGVGGFLPLGRVLSRNNPSMPSAM